MDLTWKCLTVFAAFDQHTQQSENYTVLTWHDSLLMLLYATPTPEYFKMEITSSVQFVNSRL